MKAKIGVMVACLMTLNWLGGMAVEAATCKVLVVTSTAKEFFWIQEIYSRDQGNS